MAQDLKTSSVMSKHNNVNPGQYKVGGRLRPGDDSTEQQQAKAQASIQDHQLRQETRDRKHEDE